MKTIFRKLFVLILVMSIGAPMYVSTTTAAPQEMTAAQKAKAKEKAKKEKEREKAAAAKAKEREKANAAKAKEREKANAQKEKERAQAAKEAEKKKAEAEKKRAVAAKEADKKREETAKANEARQKEAAKAQAERQKEQAKAQAERQKEQEKKQREKDKIAAEKARQAEQQAAQEAKQKEAYYAQFEEKKPKTETVSLFNLYFRGGYAAMFDKIQLEDRKLIGGPGAGLGLAYELEHGKFRFNTGLDFTWLNSASKYGYMFSRPVSGSGGNIQHMYLISDYKETRNLGYVGVPVMLGAQFGRYYFLVGAKVGYMLMDSYSGKGTYDIIEKNKLINDYLPVAADKDLEKMSGKNKLNPLDLSVCAEFGLDLDEWMQKQPSPDKAKQKVKAGERLPFGREHVHYRISIFADYSVLNNKNEKGQLPLTFHNAVNNQQAPTGSNAMVTIQDGSPLANLFVGVKFTIQFEVPGKTPRQVPPPASYADIRVLDNATNQLLPNSTIEITDTKANRVKLKEKVLKQGTHKQRLTMGEYSVYAQAENYYPLTYPFTLDSAGVTKPIDLRLNHLPIFRVSVANKETGMALPAKVLIRKRGTEQSRYTLDTDSASGTSRAQLSDTVLYSLHIEQLGYEPYDAEIANVGDSMHIELVPIKKGEVFIMKNLIFATNKTRILPVSEQALTDLYMFMQRNPQVRIRIMGHTDSVGKDKANQKLSEGRANAVRDELIERGIAPERIVEAIGFGESKPIDTNDTDEGRQNNRRVEIEIM